MREVDVGYVDTFVLFDLLWIDEVLEEKIKICQGNVLIGINLQVVSLHGTFNLLSHPKQVNDILSVLRIFILFIRRNLFLK